MRFFERMEALSRMAELKIQREVAPFLELKITEQGFADSLRITVERSALTIAFKLPKGNPAPAVDEMSVSIGLDNMHKDGTYKTDCILRKSGVPVSLDGMSCDDFSFDCYDTFDTLDALWAGVARVAAIVGCVKKEAAEAASECSGGESKAEEEVDRHDFRRARSPSLD